MLRAIAAHSLKKEWLQRWWCKKYNRPSKDPLLAAYTMEELMVEYLKDSIELDPGEAFPMQALENGVQFQRTGDDVIDSWERDIAKGKAPDFAKAFASSEDKAVFEAWLKPKKSDALPQVQVDAQPSLDDDVPEWVKDLVGDGTGFNDVYTTQDKE